MFLDTIIPFAKSRFVVIHYHIFKNAGTTIEHILEREFPGRFARVHGRDSDCALDAQSVLGFLQDHPHIAALTSHHFRYPKPVDRQIVFFDCCFLRDPMERLYSSYLHCRRSGQEDTYSRWARCYSAREFAMRMIDEAPHQVSDVQVNYLGNGGTFVRPADQRDLDRATLVIRDMAIPGVVDMFDESMVVAEYYLHPAFPNLRCQYLRRNVSEEGSHHGAELRHVWGIDVHEQLLRMNALDLKLIRRARHEILRRLDGVPRFAEKLADFRFRCARLASASTGVAVQLSPVPRIKQESVAAAFGSAERA